MAKKKNTNLSYDKYVNKYGNKSAGTISYDQLMARRAQQNEQAQREALAQKKQADAQQKLGDYFTRLRSRAQTAATKKAYQDARWSPNGDQSHLVYAAKMIADTPGALEKEQARQRAKATEETRKMQKLTQDLTHGYGGRYDPSLAYQAAQMGVKADQVRGIVEQNEKNYRALDEINKQLNAQKNTTYAGIKADREQNKTGYNLTMEQFNRMEAKNRQNTAEGLNNNGSELFRMNDEGLAAYKQNAAEEAEKRRAKIKEYEAYDPETAKAGLFERFYQKDLANEQAILDNPVYKGTDFEKNAQARMAELQSGYAANWRQAVGNTDRLLENGYNFKGKTPEEQQAIREEVYNSIMPDTYRDRIKKRGDKEELDAAIDEYITGLSSPWGEGSKNDAMEALEREASAFDNQVKAAEEEETYRGKMGAFDKQFEQMRGMGISQTYDPTIAPQVQTIISGDDMVYQVQGSEADKAYWWANNYGEIDQYGGVNLKTANKYMFLATDPEILDKYNTFYQFDKQNGTNSAQAFLDGIDPYLSTMLTNYQDYYARSIAEKPVEGLIARGATYGAAPIMGLIGTAGAITALFGNESAKDNTSNWYAGTRFIQDVRSQQNEDVAEWADRVIGNGSGKVAKFMLGVIDSIGDNVTAMGGATLAAGEGTKTAMRLVQLIMSGEATSNKMVQSLEDGMDPTEAALYAVGDGVIEWLTERYSLEQIMGPDVRQLYGNKRAMASFLMRSAGAEGSEEIASDLLNMGLDSVLSMIYGHEDELKQRYNELVTQYNMTDAEASRQVFEDKLREIGLSGLAGALSGLGMAGSRVVSTAMETGRQGQNIQANEGGMDTMLKLAQQMKEGTDSRALADQLAAEIEKGSAVSNYDLGRLANLTALDVGETRSQVIRDTVGRNVLKQLTDAGIAESEAKQYADIITRSIFEGKRLNKAEIETLSKDERAIKLWGDFNTMSQASRNLAKEVKAETKELDSIAEKVGELVSPEAEQESAAARAVQESMKEAGSTEEAIDNLQAKNSGLLSEGYAQLAKTILKENPIAGKSRNYLDDIMKIRLAAMTMDSMPKTGLEKDVAQRFYDAAKAEFDEADASRVVPQKPALEGQGKATFNGAEYGTQAWKDATAGMSKLTRNVMGAVGEIAARFGHVVNLVNDPENPDVYGFEDADTGAITINVANGFKHHMLVTLAHEMTHWLEQNSRGGYNDLRSFVLDSLRAQGVNVQERIVKIMDNYNMVMKPEAGKGMTINQAMAELVAQSSEGLLSSRRAAQELQNTNPGLYSRVKTYVQDVVARINAAIKGMNYESSLSTEARALEKYRDQLADIWFNGRKDAQGTSPAVQAEQEEQTEVRNEAEGQKSFSVAQKEDQELDRLYEELNAARAEEQEARENFRAIDGESKAWVDKAMAAMKTGDESNVMAEYKKWEEEVYTPLSQKLSEATQRVKAANKAFEEYTENRDMAAEQQAIEKSGLSEPDYRRKQAVNEFGYTTDFREAGYMLPNGRMLNFTGEKGRHMGSRGQDHRAIETIYASRQIERGQAMIKFMADGNIRVMAETPGIDIIKEPTAEQYAQIRAMARRFAGEEYFNVDFTDERGNTIDSIEYDGRVNADRIVNDIKHYYKTGEVPQQSTVSQFHYSIAQRDAAYQKAVDSGNVEEQQRLVDEAAKEAGYNIKAYHGTGRADRVGTVFLPERATSGPMAFFTDNREIAENYARDKQDTSVAYDEEYGDYHTQFRVKDKKGKSIPVSQLWNTLSYRERNQILKKAKQITWDDEMENIIIDPEATSGNGGFQDWTLRENGGNAIETLIYAWLDGRDLYNQEERFLEVLKLAGIKGVTWNNPDARVEKVYDTLLKIQNPFSTDTMFTNEFVDGLLEWWDEQEQDKYKKESAGADLWDKNNRTVEEWADMARDNVENGRTTVWTSIPDAVTDYLKSMGYDGIKDEGGKGGGAGHTVWIPFTSEQIKSADPVTYDDAGNVIPPSQRFNEQQKDIRWSIAQGPDMEVNNFMLGLNEFNLPTYQEKTMLRQYKDSRTRADLLRYGIREREIERRKLLAKEKRSIKDNKRLGEINRFLDRDRAKLDSLEKELVRVTGEKGYARLMMNQENIMKNLTTGQSAADLEETVNNIQQNLDNVTKEMAERAEELKKLASAEAVVRIRQQFNARGLKQIAAKLKSDLGSELENKEIENRLALIALKMKEGKYDAENAEELADLLAGRMKAEYDGYVISELRGSTITLGPVQLKELKASGRNMSDIRQQLAGTGIRISTEGNTTLDSKWDDLCRVIPSLDPQTNPGDMLDEILKLVNDEKGMRASVFSDENLMNINRQVLEAAQKLIPEIITDEKSLKLIRESLALVARISGAAKSNAEALEEVNSMIDRLQKKSQKAIIQAKQLTGDVESTIEYFDQLSLQSEAAMWKSERIRLIEQMKSDNTKALMEEADRWRERIEKDKAYRELAGENMQTRRRITTNVSRVRKLLINETDLKNVPEHMKGLAREMLGKIMDNDMAGRKLTGLARKDIAETSRILAEMRKQDGDFTPEDLRLLADEEAQAAVADALADLEEGLKEYNSHLKGSMMENANSVKETLKKISDAVSVITGVINAERSISFLDRQIPLADAAEDIQREMKNTRHKGEWTGTGSGAVNAVKRSVVYGNMTPEYYIKNLRNRGMTELWKDAQEGENRNGLEVQKAKQKLAQLAEETGYKSWAKETHEVTLGGQKRIVTIGNMMEIYAIWKREQTENPEMSQHMTKGGIFIEQKDAGGKLRREQTQQRAIRVTDEEVQKMYDGMTEQQKKYIEGIVSYLSNEMSDLGNEASMRMYGIKKYKETYYFPMKVWDGVKSARSDKGITGTDENRAAHRSWSKRRQHMASNALVIGDFTADAVNHVVEMINYNTMAPAIENINKVLNYKFTEEAGTDNETQRNMRVMFQEAYGRDALNYLETLLKDMNGGVAQDQRKTLRDRTLTIFKKNAVAGSLSVALQQPLSYIRASMMINPKYLAPGVVANNWKNSYKEMMQYSGVAVIKRMGRFDMNFGQSAKDFITPETKTNLYNKASDMLTAAPELMDAMTWTWMWGAVKAETKAKHPGADVNSENFMKEVARRFNEVMRKTQVYDSVLVKSSNMRSQNLGMKVLTSFMAEPTLSLNVLADALRNTKAEGGKKTLIKALATFFTSAVMQAAVKGLMGSGRTPDKNKTWLENFLNKFQYNLMNEGNMVSLIPGYSDLIEVLKTGELKDDAMGAIGKLTSIVDTLRKASQGNGKGAYRDFEDTVGQFVQLFSNIPMKNLMRDGRAIYNWIVGDQYAARPTSGNVLKYQTEANFFNADTLGGTINTWLGEAGFVTTSSRYYSRIYNAMKNGDQGTAAGLKEYMSLAKGTSDDAMKNGIKSAAKKDDTLSEAEKDSWLIKNNLMGENNVSTITAQYKEGKISAAEARKLWKELNPALTDNDLYWKQDRLDYQKETGNEASGYNYRLKDAIQSNKGEEIRKAVKSMLDHGRTQKQIKDALSDWKATYLAADSKGRTAIRNALQIAYKAIGLTAADADKTVEGWQKEKKKTTK